MTQSRRCTRRQRVEKRCWLRIKVRLTLFLSCSCVHDKKYWLFTGSRQAGECAVTLLGLIEWAKLKGHDAWVYLKGMLTILPTWSNSLLTELRPHRWVVATST